MPKEQPWLHNPELADYHGKLLGMSPEQLDNTFVDTIDSLPELKKDIPRLVTAYDLMKEHHGSQTRTLTQDPYDVHPQRVTLLYIFHTKQQGKDVSGSTIAAGLLHDGVEDTSLTREMIASSVGEKVAKKVTILTKPEHVEGKKAKDKATIQQARTAHEEGEEDILELRTMDRVDNIRDRAGVVEVTIFSSDEEKKRYKKFKKKVKNTKEEMIPHMLHDHRDLQGVLEDVILISKEEMRERTLEHKKKVAA